MFIVLVGPKGSGKSHIGRIMERRLGVRFFNVEPLWTAFHAECRAAGHEPGIAEGISRVHPRIAIALRDRAHLCVETTGASPEILQSLLSLEHPARTLIVRVDAPLALCLARIAARDPGRHIPSDDASIQKVHELSEAAAVDAALTLDNWMLSEGEIVARLEPYLQAQETQQYAGFRNSA